jgi:hypothetical protein
MTQLKTEEHLAPVIPGGKGRKALVFEVIYKIVMRYDGLNICFRVQYKKGEKTCEIEGKEYWQQTSMIEKFLVGT